MRDSALNRIRALVERLAPEPICDDCITERLGLSARQEGTQRTREIAGTAGFERQLNTCTLCGQMKKVTRKKVERSQTDAGRRRRR